MSKLFATNKLSLDYRSDITKFISNNLPVHPSNIGHNDNYIEDTQ
jgi:hypothetical protein